MNKKTKRRLELIPDNHTISLPVRATYTVDRTTGQIIEKSFEYADLPAAAVSDFFFSRFGIDAKPREIELLPGTVFAVGEYIEKENDAGYIKYLEPRFNHESLALAYLKTVITTFGRFEASQYSVFKIDSFGLGAEDILR